LASPSWIQETCCSSRHCITIQVCQRKRRDDQLHQCFLIRKSKDCHEVPPTHLPSADLLFFLSGLNYIMWTK
jgi:hypothetical protein